MNGLLQLVPEYAGSALQFTSLGRLSATSDAAAANRALARSVAGRGLVAARPAPAQDANAIVVTAATAARYGLRSIADLARAAPRLVFGGPPECPERAYCLPGLQRAYGLRFKAFIPLDAGGPLTLQALEAGNIGVALLFTTDPAIPARHLVILADDRGLQPAENITPLVRRDVIVRYGPNLVALLNRISALLDTGTLRALDAQVELDGHGPRLGGQALAARARADPGRGCCALSEHIGRAAAGDGRATVPPGPAVRKARRQRRPTGAPPPLPHPVNRQHAAWLVLVAVGLAGAFLAAQHTPWLRVDDRVSTCGASLAGGDADAVADRRGQRDQGGGHELGGHRARRVAGHPDGGVPALAAPAGVLVQPVFPGNRRSVDLQGAVPAAPVRRADHRQLGRATRRRRRRWRP